MCLKSFIALRGTPKVIYSDNGTNFKATEKVVKEDLKRINHPIRRNQMEIQPSGIASHGRGKGSFDLLNQS